MDHQARIDGIGCLAGIAPWKRKRIAAIFANRHGPPLAKSAREAVRLARRNGGAVACWASRHPPGLVELARAGGVEVWSIEDGFIRSAGLGVALVQPGSVVLDRLGIHYDAAEPSELEQLLERADFAPGLLARADTLIAALRTRGITKYNLAGGLPELPQGRRVVLVAGQVEDDLSVKLGGKSRTMAEVLARARAEEPDAFLVYKPHPDVVSGLRDGLVAGQADLVLPQADLAGLLERVDAVHVLTSLTGFEALLRGCEVVVHGAPFYAGWGLTRDLDPPPRRGRQLSLAELVAGALIEYPLYWDPAAGRRCEVEVLVERLAQGGTAPPPAGWQRIRAVLAGRLGAAKRKVTG